MNNPENYLVKNLLELKNSYFAEFVKFEYEYEGTRLEDIMRFKELASKANLKVMLKIGGCEAVRDLMEARLIGVDALVAPMIESGYALKKYIDAIKKVFDIDELQDIKIYFNIESISAFENIDEILESVDLDIIEGVIFERVDICKSFGLTEDDINNIEIMKKINEISLEIKRKGLKIIIGGGFSQDSVAIFESMGINIDYFETRKVTFKKEGLVNAKDGVLKALEFEVNWLKSKKEFYKNILNAEKERIALIENKYLNV